MVALVLAASATAQAAPPRVVVFDVEDAAPGGSLSRGRALSARARRRIGAERRFRLVSAADTREAVRASGRRRCTYPLCQVEVLRELGADLGISVLLFRARPERCAAAARYFDGLTRPAAPVAVRVGPCEPVEPLLDAALDGLLRGEAPAPPPRARPPPPEAPDRGVDRRAALRLAREGRERLRSGRLEAAREKLRACLARHPLPACHRSLGVLEAKAGRGEIALEHYRAYLELAPAAPDAAEVRAILKKGS